MATAVMGNPQLFQDDQIIYGIATGSTNIITKGDWVQWSGGFVVNWGTQATPAFRFSGIGIALDNNPIYDPLGRAVQNTALPILTHGVLRVSASAASLSGLPALGSPMTFLATASGIVGTTGATGQGAMWSAVLQIGVTATATTVASGIAKLINIVKSGDSGVGQADILFDARNNYGII